MEISIIKIVITTKILRDRIFHKLYSIPDTRSNFDYFEFDPTTVNFIFFSLLKSLHLWTVNRLTSEISSLDYY